MTAMLASLVNAGILSALLAAAVWLVMRRRLLNAATRYLVWWAVLAVTLALPLLYWPMTGMAPATALQQPERIDSADAPVQAAAPLPRVSIPPSAGSWSERIVAAWALFAAILLARLLASYWLLRRTRARAVAAPAADLRFAVSDEIAMPMVAGVRHPVILMPARLMNQLPEDDLRQILMHEAAHIARGDGYALLVQRTVEAIFPLHPIVRWLARRIELEREIACDDVVLATTGQARPYAECLVRVAELAGGAPGPSPAATASSHLSVRVTTLLDNARHTGTRPLRSRLAAALATLAALAVILAKMPGPMVLAQESRVVMIAAAVLDPLNRYVTGLAQDNFHLFENGVEQQIVHFSASDSPVSAAIVSDASTAAREAARTFVMVGNLDDVFSLATTTPGEAIGQAMRHLEKNAKHPRKALLVISDAPVPAASDVEIYAIRIANADDMILAARRAAIELRNRYLLGYSSAHPERDGAFQTVRVVLAPPRGLPPLHVRTAHGYYAPR